MVDVGPTLGGVQIDIPRPEDLENGGLSVMARGSFEVANLL